MLPLKLLQSLIKALHSEGTPGQVAAGIALGSNLDRAVAARLRAVVGEEAARAERTVRAQVDSIAERATAPVRGQVAAVTSDATGQLAERKGRLEQAQRTLEQRLRDLTRGIRLP